MIRYHASWILPIVEPPIRDGWLAVDRGRVVALGSAGRRVLADGGLLAFNAWGGLYASWEQDDAMAAAVCATEGADRYRAPFVLEGGSIHADGEGTLLLGRRRS